MEKDHKRGAEEIQKIKKKFKDNPAPEHLDQPLHLPLPEVEDEGGTHPLQHGRDRLIHSLLFALHTDGDTRQHVFDVLAALERANGR